MPEEEKEVSIGIDLGTTNTVVAYCKKDNENNLNTRVLEIRTGKKLIPSVVSFSKDKLLVGQEAWNNAVAAPHDTIFSIKRLMGRSFNDINDIEVRKLKDKVSYKIEAGVNKDVTVSVCNEKYKPEDISAMILRYVVGEATRILKQEVTHAVITVPAYFSELQREATLKAGVDAGLVVKKILDEPTAAAIAFGEEHSDEKHKLLVFDMGGGTLDITTGYISERKFVNRAIDGDRWMGGDDFDQKIIDMIITWVKEIYAFDPSNDKRFLMLAKHAAEKAKCSLSDNPQTDITIPGGFSMPDKSPGSVKMTITRKEFEEKIKSDVEKSISLVTNLMKSNNIDAENITKVLLVGGSTYIPLIRQKLEEIFGKQKVQHDVNPMEAVAIGAAILAKDIHGIGCPKLICGHINNYGTKNCTRCGTSLSTARDAGTRSPYSVTERALGIGAVEKGEQDVFSIIIEKGTSYPLKEPKEKRYITTGHQIKIPVYSGNEPRASMNEYLGLVKYQLPEHLHPRTPVNVKFNFDRNRLLTVGIEVEGYPERVELRPDRNETIQSLSKDKEQWSVKIENLIALTDLILKQYGEFITQEQINSLNKEKEQAKKVIAENKLSEAQNTLTRFLVIIDQLGVASRLFIAERLMTQTDSDTAQWLAMKTKNLKDAYREGKQAEVSQLSTSIDQIIQGILQKMPVSTELRGFSGWLEVYSGK